MALTNGQVPASLLVPVQGALTLRKGPAAAWAAVCSEVHRRFGWTPTLTDAYRSEAAQEALFRSRYSIIAGNGPYGDVRDWPGHGRYVRVSAAGPVAVPGTSNHGWGMAIDVKDLGGFTATKRAQFATVAGPLGWSDTEGRANREPWHWVYTGPADTVSNVVSQILSTLPTAPGAPALTPPQEADMLKDDPELQFEVEWFKERIKQVVEWENQRFNDVAAYTNQRVNDLAGFVQGAIAKIPGVDTAALAAAVAQAVKADLPPVAAPTTAQIADELAKRLAQ